MIVGPQITPFAIHKYFSKFNSLALVAIMMMKNVFRCLVMTQRNEAKTTTNKWPTNRTVRLLQSSLSITFILFFCFFFFVSLSFQIPPTISNDSQFSILFYAISRFMLRLHGSSSIKRWPKLNWELETVRYQRWISAT